MYRPFIALCLMWVMPSIALAGISAGPMLGHATPHTASIWLQADGAGGLQLEYWPDRNPGKRRMSGIVHLDASTDYAARIELTGLEPGTRYSYAIYLDQVRQPANDRLVFATLPGDPWRKALSDFTVYLGSCAFIDDPATDARDKPYGDGYEIFESIAASAVNNPNLHLMLWLGDAVYLRDADYASPWGMNSRYRQARTLPELQPLLRSTRHYALWDDHDYGPNNSNRSFIFKDDSLALFQRYWANPSYGQKALPGIFTTFSFLDVDFFLLDDRYYRAADDTAEPKEEIDLLEEAKDMLFGYNAATRILGKPFRGQKLIWLGERKVMFGSEQLDWLKQALLQSRATFKIIASGSQLFNDASRFEGWHNFRLERETFVTWLTKQDIPGVLFLSGDRHHTELIRRERKDAYPLHELTCSPLTSSPRTAGQEEDNRQRVPGTLVSQRNWCRIDVHGPAKARTLTLQSLDAAGRVLWSHELQAADLRKAVTEAP